MSYEKAAYLSNLRLFIGATFEDEFDVREDGVPIPVASISEVEMIASVQYTHNSGTNLFELTLTGGEISVASVSNKTIVSVEMDDSATALIDYATLRNGQAYYETFLTLTDGRKLLFKYGQLDIKGKVATP